MGRTLLWLISALLLFLIAAVPLALFELGFGEALRSGEVGALSMSWVFLAEARAVS